MKNRITYIIALFLICLGSAVKAGNHPEDHVPLNWSEEKYYTKSFAANSSSTVSVTNKYGDVKVENWDKDSVFFEVKIVAEADEAQHAKALIQIAEVEFITSGSQIEANLLWGKDLNTVKRSTVDMMLSLKNNQRIQIDFTVHVPKGVNLKVENRFGNILLPEITGKCYLEVNHGDVRSLLLKDARSVYVRYGKVDIRKVINGNFDLGFSDLTIEEADDISVKSSNTDIIIEKVQQVNFKSNNDHINIESAQKVSGSMMMSDTRIRELGHSLSLTCRFGDLNVRKVMSGFAGIMLDGNLTDISLAFENSASFGYTVSLENGKSFAPPAGNSKYEEQVVGKSKIINGSFGNGGANKVNVSVKASVVRFEQSF